MSGIVDALAAALDVRTFVLRDALVKAGVASGAYHASKALERIIYGKADKGAKADKERGGHRRLVAPEGRKTTIMKEISALPRPSEDALDALNNKIILLRNQIDSSERHVRLLHSNHEGMGFYGNTAFGAQERHAILEEAVAEGKKVFAWKHELANTEHQISEAAVARAASVKTRSEVLDPQFRRYARDFRRRQRAIRVVKESYLTKYARRKKKW